MVQVRVRLYATLRSYRPEHVHDDGHQGFLLSVDEGTTLRSLVNDYLRIPPGTVKMMFVNGIGRADTYVLADGDEVGIFPPIAGG